MIRIAVVDDEEEMIAEIHRCIEESAAPQGDIEIDSFTSAEDFLGKLNQGHEFNVLLCDIGLSEMSGIELGKIIHEQKRKTFLVFLTSYEEYAAESYAIEAYQYILKEHMYTRLPLILQQLIDKIKRESKQYVHIGTTINKDKIYYRDIVYICKKKGAKYVQYVTMDGEYQDRMTLDQVISELHSEEFIMVNRAYIINIKYIARMRGNEIFMENGERITISRTRFTKVKEQINLLWRRI